MRAIDLERDALFVTLAGSQAHGTADSRSDIDLRGVCLAPLALRVSLFQRFEQWEGELGGALAETIAPRLAAHESASRCLHAKRECVVYELAKFLRLCSDANPNALEILFADERDWLYETPAWRTVYAARRSFLSLQVQRTYLGYAAAQLQRIRTHRAWLIAPPASKPMRAQFGLPESATLGREDRDRVEEGIADRLRSLRGEPGSEEELRARATSELGLPASVVESLNAERRYRAALKHWQSYETWKRERNPARAELERRFGYDTKHAMHLVRMMRTGLELLETGELRVRRADAEELRAIRDGAFSYEALLAHAAELEARVQRAAARASLPAEVDRGAVEKLFWDLVRPR